MIAASHTSRTVFLAPVTPGFGMSSIALGFVRAFQREGVRVAYVKPVCDFDCPEDGSDRSVHFVRSMCALAVPEPIPAARAARMIREGDMPGLLEEIVGLVETARGDADVVVVEGLPPSIEHPLGAELDLAVPRNLHAEVVAVVSGRRGETDPIVEAVGDANHRYADDGGHGLAGVLVARVPDGSRLGELAQALQARGLTAPLVGVVVDNPAHSAARLIDFVADLGFSVYRRGNLEHARVTNIVVAALGADKLVSRLLPGALVVTPGDRADALLTTALVHAAGMPVAGLLLTCGEPMPASIDAFLAPRIGDLPILTTPLDTYDAAVQLSTVDRRVRAQDHERMAGLMDHVADQIDVSAFTTPVSQEAFGRMTPPMFRHRLIQAARRANRRIVLPEGDEPRTVRAAAICTEKRIARCVLLGDPARIRAVAATHGIQLPEGIEIIDPATLRTHYVAPLLALGRARGITPDQAEKHLEDTILLGTMMLAQGDVDGLVSGAVHTTAATVRPALRLIRTAPGSTIVSSVFFMLMPDQVLVYGDCAINPDPSASQLAEIAVQSAESARAFGIDPRVAMISYSTGSSAEGEQVDKVREATRLVKERRPDLVIDGPIQYDAASVESVGRQKAPGSPLGGQANVFVFPDLNTGNTTYKAVQRSAGVVSVGPLLQGLRKPVNDLSRGALVDDIVYTIAMTAIQAQG